MMGLGFLHGGRWGAQLIARAAARTGQQAGGVTIPCGAQLQRTPNQHQPGEANPEVTASPDAAKRPRHNMLALAEGCTECPSIDPSDKPCQARPSGCPGGHAPLPARSPVVQVGQAPRRVQRNLHGAPHGEHLRPAEGVGQRAAAHQLRHQDVRLLLGAGAQELRRRWENKFWMFNFIFPNLIKKK